VKTENLEREKRRERKKTTYGVKSACCGKVKTQHVVQMLPGS